MFNMSCIILYEIICVFVVIGIIKMLFIGIWVRLFMLFEVEWLEMVNFKNMFLKVWNRIFFLVISEWEKLEVKKEIKKEKRILWI